MIISDGLPVTDGVTVGVPVTDGVTVGVPVTDGGFGAGSGARVGHWVAPTPPALPDGPLVGPERPMLQAFLEWHRHTLLNICAGLTAAQLAVAAVPPSNLTLLGLVRHLAKVERRWLSERVAGQQLEPMFDPALGTDADFEDVDPATAETDFARYAEVCRTVDQAVAAKDLDDTFELHGQTHSLRLVYIHLIEEYARHNGHADLLRQAIDGVTDR